MQQTTLQSNKVYCTENNNTIVTYKVKDYEIVTTNYVNDEIIVTIYNADSECLAICTFLSIGGRYNFQTLVCNVDESLVENLMEDINKVICKTELIW